MIRREARDTHIAIANKQHSNKRYYMEESRQAMAILHRLRRERGAEGR